MPSPLRKTVVTTTISLVAIVTAGFSTHATAQDPVAGAEGQARPTLVVSLTVDQLSQALFERYADLYQFGFRRLLDQGFSFTQATHDHAITETAPGHATLSTGVYPSRHGVVANVWREQTPAGWAQVYAVEDTLSPILGVEGIEGRSPYNLIRTGLADWIMAADSDARVASISTKDRAAIPMAGKSRGHVYWIEPQLGRFITSTYYRDEYPDWVESFNDEIMAELFTDSIWTLEVPAELVTRARPDAAPFEADGGNSEFPHVAGKELTRRSAAAYGTWFRETPRWDEGSLWLTLRALEELELGRRGSVDYLSVSFSQVDYVGHKFGPFSLEQLDNLMRLDRLVGALMDGLDRAVGEGGWVMGFSADHGILEMPEWRVEQGMPGRRLSRLELDEFIGEIQDILNRTPYMVDARNRVEAFLREQPFVEQVYRQEHHVAGEQPDTFGVLFKNSNLPGRYAGLLAQLGFDVRFTEGTLSDGLVGRTTHGTPYWYDRHVPVFFLGAGVPAGTSEEPVHTVDLAPTLANLAGIPIPEGLDGRPIVLIVR